MSEVQLEVEQTPIAGFREAARIQQSLVTRTEKRVLNWLAERTPRVVNSDHLTILGAVGMLLAGVSYALCRYSDYGLPAACFFLAVNWLGDSLDGTLARFRQHQRPRYGFYVDHVIDCFGVTALIGGMGLSSYLQPLIAAWLLIAYLLLSSEIFLATYSLARFEMSYFQFGPTELRILLCVGNLYVFFRPSTHPFASALTLFDIGAVIGGVGMVAMAVFSAVRHTRLLYDAERLQ